MLVFVALANKTARIAWALMTKGSLPSFDRRRLSAGSGQGCREGVRRSKDRYGAKSERRDQENQAHGSASSARSGDVNLILELPYGRAAMRRPR
ncbi:hypothetical protein X761_33095 [Mesorhizobium sp. LSHC424B00]|nr:hypothetical protein X761_33095 [Mesorhizobium sp. LSHC424B00]